MIRVIPALALAALLAGASGADAADSPPLPNAGNPLVWPSPEAEAKLRSALDQMVNAVEQMVRELPRYAAPEINERGDIILRRLDPPPATGRRDGRPGQDDDHT